MKLNHLQIKKLKADITRSLFIPNDQHDTTVDVSKTHKGKKLNYICSINPTNIHRITGKITNIGNQTIFAGDGRFIAEFVIVAKKN